MTAPLCVIQSGSSSQLLENDSVRIVPVELRGSGVAVAEPRALEPTERGAVEQSEQCS